MMITQLMTTNQLETLFRQQQRQKEREYQKKLLSLQQRTRNSNLPISFDNSSVTAFGNYGILEAFKQAIGFRDMLSRIHLKRHHNCKYTGPEILDTMIDAISLGLLRFSHMNALQTDPGYQKIKEITQVPDESTLRNFLSQISEQKALEQMPLVNQELLSLKAKSDKPVPCGKSSNTWINKTSGSL